jgi:hypothetical protein
MAVFPGNPHQHTFRSRKNASTVSLSGSDVSAGGLVSSANGLIAIKEVNLKPIHAAPNVSVGGYLTPEAFLYVVGSRPERRDYFRQPGKIRP